MYKLYSRDNGGEVAIVEHPFEVGFISAPHRHAREDEHSHVLEGEIGFRSDDWRILRKLRCCPWHAGQLAKAIHVLQIRET